MNQMNCIELFEMHDFANPIKLSMFVVQISYVYEMEWNKLYWLPCGFDNNNQKIIETLYL